MKRYYTVTKKGIIIALAILLIAVFVFVVFCFGGSSTAVSSSVRKLPVYSVDRNDKSIALSFDAAWGNEDTQELIDILAENNLKATFFVVGSWVDKYPESVKALSDAGHQVQNHSDTHPYMTTLSKEDMRRELENCNKKIEAITGVRPTLFRPPYGDYDNSVIDVVNSLGMTTIQWSVDSLDWKDLSAGEITSRVTKNVASGSIILFHNAAKNTPQALPGIIKSLLAEGYKPIFINDLIYHDNYTIDPDGKQHKKEEDSSLQDKIISGISDNKSQ